LLVVPTFLVAQSGKISGRVVGSDTGEPLPGANVVIVGTSIGASSDVDGFYTIINVPPGNYTLQSSFIGYARLTVEDVHVNINQTTTIDFNLQAEAVAGEEVTIVSVRPVVEADVSANVANVAASQVENLPIAGIDAVVTLQAGVEPNMSIRGAGINQMGYTVDGVSMRDGRDNEPWTGISYTAFDEVQVQTGGFNAEYGNIRSGLVQVTTKDPGAKYNMEAYGRYKPIQELNFSGQPNDPNSFYVRPFTDPAVKLEGTANGNWDRYTQRQYDTFVGWNAASAGSPGIVDDFGNAVDTLTAAQMEQIYDWHTRKNNEIDDPDYDLDLTVGGPLIPGGNQLGNLRFLASYRKIQEAYFIPQANPVYDNDTWQFKVTSDIKPTMKLSALGVISNETGMSHDNYGRVDNHNIVRGGSPLYPWSDREIVYGPDDHRNAYTIFGTDQYTTNSVDRVVVGLKLTHALSPNTFYEARAQYSGSDYLAGPGRLRDVTTVANTVGPYQLNEAPFGFSQLGITSPGSQLRLSGHNGRSRDSSNVSIIALNLDVTSQVNRTNQVKGGIEVLLNNYDMQYQSYEQPSFPQSIGSTYEEKPYQVGLYLQDKLEFRGMIMNLGVRADMFSAAADWPVFDPYDRRLTAAAKPDRTLFDQESTEAQFAVSPRVGVSFPISADSKLYFNYGHFRQNLDPIRIYQFEKDLTRRISRVANPNAPLQKTIAYEIGYDQNVADQYLVRVSGYYRDVSNQTSRINYTSIDNLIDYDLDRPYNYSDVRGLEFTLNKTRGRFFRGFVNATYLQTKDGDFGYAQQFENLVTQREYIRDTEDHYQDKPVAEPFGNLNLEWLSPSDYGDLLGDWSLNLLGQYRAGRVFTWSGRGGSIPGLQQNIRMRDFWDFDLRLSKTLRMSFGSATVFLDINNVFNFKYMYFVDWRAQGGPFQGTNDWEIYMESLHLDPNVFEDIDEDQIPYNFVPGSDKPGDFRDEGVDFVPIEIVTNQAALPADAGYLEPAGISTKNGRRVLYYAKDSGTYYEYQNGAWAQADQGFVGQVLDDKAYIDMPNETWRTFLNPRSFLFGVRLSF
jgi:hypothetical protein